MLYLRDFIGHKAPGDREFAILSTNSVQAVKLDVGSIRADRAMGRKL